MADAGDLAPLGEAKIVFADGLSLYQPDMVIWGDSIGAKIGGVIIIFRPGIPEAEGEKD